MRKTLILLCWAAAATVATAAPRTGGPAPADPATGRNRPEYKPYVRWWWPGSAVDRRGLAWNLSEFARQGIGGMEITPIYGVRGNEAADLAYLSPEWMEAYGYTVELATELGLQVDMSNCTGWPFGGPWIDTDRSAQKYILERATLRDGERLAEPLRPKDARQQQVAQLQALQAVCGTQRIDLLPFVSADGRLEWQAPQGTWTLYALYAGRTFQKVKRAAPGGEGLVLNHYNREAVAYYLQRFDQAFAASGAPWPDTFFNDSFEVYGASWDTTLPAEFERDHGYRLQDYLPEFAAAGADELSARIVRDYRQTLADMLLRNFTRPWAAWAHAHGCRVRNQAHGSPGNIFDFYAAVDIPECESFGRTEFDIPGLRRDPAAKPSDADPAVLKFASSAAHVTGKPLTSCETLTWLTEHFHTSLAQCKPEIDQILASGVNHVYFHGAPYTPAEAPFPGWLFYASINLSPAATLWRDAAGLFDYVARCQRFLQEGRPDNEVLLYIPMEDISRSQQGKNLLLFDIHKMDRTMPELKRTMNAIVRGGFDADYISDRYLLQLGVRDGALVPPAAATRYKTLVMPDCRLIPHETLARVLELARQGATVVFLGRYPDDVPGYGRLETRRKALRKSLRQLPAADFATLAEHRFGRGRILTGNNLSALLTAAGATREPLKEQGVQLIRRTGDNGKRYFFSLLGGSALDGWAELGTAAREVVVTDPVTGRSGLAATRPTPRGTTEVYLQLQPGESRLLEARTRPLGDVSAHYHAVQRGEGITGHDWELSFPDAEPAIDSVFRLAAPRSWTDLTPELAVYCGTGRYTARFTVPDPAAADGWVLDLGDLRESARVRINGHDAGIVWAVPFRIEAGAWLQPGENSVEIDVTNLPANRIADYDRRGVTWRIFKDANIVSALNGPLDTSGWQPEPSGLNSNVTLFPVTTKTVR